MHPVDGPEERRAELDELSVRDWERIEREEQRADELRDVLIDIATPVRL